MTFTLSNILAPISATVVATLIAPDGVTTIASMTLTPGSPATVYGGSTSFSAPDSADPYTYSVVANGTDIIIPAGTIYGFVQGGVLYSQTVEPTQVQIAPTVIGTVQGQAIVQPGLNVYYRLADPPVGDGNVYDGSVKTAVPDADGLINVPLLQNAEYEWWVSRGERKSLLTGTTSPVLIPVLISDQTAAI